MFELADYLVGIYKVEDCTRSLTIPNYDKERVLGFGEKENVGENTITSPSVVGKSQLEISPSKDFSRVMDISPNKDVSQNIMEVSSNKEVSQNSIAVSPSKDASADMDTSENLFETSLSQQ